MRYFFFNLHNALFLFHSDKILNSKFNVVSQKSKILMSDEQQKNKPFSIFVTKIILECDTISFTSDMTIFFDILKL